MKVWLDDERDPSQFTGESDWVWVKTVKACWELILGGEVTDLSLDNDLGMWEVEGHVIADRIEEKQATENWDPPRAIRVHSMNPVARKRMIQTLVAIERRRRRKS